MTCPSGAGKQMLIVMCCLPIRKSNVHLSNAFLVDGDRGENLGFYNFHGKSLLFKGSGCVKPGGIQGHICCDCCASVSADGRRHLANGSIVTLTMLTLCKFYVAEGQHTDGGSTRSDRLPSCIRQ